MSSRVIEQSLRCLTCGYSLHNLPLRVNVIVCPECGRQTALAEFARRHRDPLWLILAVALWPFLVTLFAGLITLVSDGKPFLAFLAWYLPESRFPHLVFFISPLHVGMSAITLLIVLYVHRAKRRAMNALWWVALLLALPFNALSLVLTFLVLLWLGAGLFLD